VVVLAGGTGGAKLARGMLEVCDRLTVIANTGDDVEIYGGHVSPDPDLVSFWLADLIDVRGWGLEGDTFAMMDGLRAIGEEVWFNLGDRDLAIAERRGRALREGLRQTEAHRIAIEPLEVPARVLPMSDGPIRTRVLAAGRWWTLQEFLIRGRGEGEIGDVQFRGARNAGTTPEVLAAIDTADLVVIGPSNPVLSIGPMLAIPELEAALRRCSAPVVAVSPLVAGAVLKGPTAAFMRWRGVPVSSEGVAEIYGDLIDGLVCDEPVSGVRNLQADLLMDTPERRVELARQTLRLAASIRAAATPGRSEIS